MAASKSTVELEGFRARSLMTNGEGALLLPQHIHCTVDNCYYWDSGNVCLAKEILVTADSAAASEPDSLDATNMMEVASEIGSTHATHCMATCCKTFHGKNRSDKPPVPKMSRAEFGERTPRTK